MTTAALFSCVRPLYDPPLVISHARDCAVFDVQGREFLDGYAGVASVSVGHGNPEVNRRVKAQIDRVVHTSMLYQTEPLNAYIQALHAHVRPELNRFFFVSSGSEALDLACQTARAARRRPLLLVLSEGFHGGSFQAKAITGLPAWQPIYGEDPNVVFLPVPVCRDCSSSGWNAASKRLDPHEIACETACLDEFAEFLRKRGDEVAAMVIEPLLGVGGILLPAVRYMRRLVEMCRKQGILVICDEVQSGFGRCGTTLFAYEQLQLRPDIVCMAKGIANGFPMGLVVAREAVANALDEKLHFSTFGGNPVSCTAALATLDVLLERRLPENAHRVGEQLMHDLNDRFLGIPECLEIRGLGLMIGIEFAASALAWRIVQESFKRGLLIGIGGRHRTVVRLEPPLTFTPDMAAKTAHLLYESFLTAQNT
jgi:4-aminobutyrate aminotransferase-like enzyme